MRKMIALMLALLCLFSLSAMADPNADWEEITFNFEDTTFANDFYAVPEADLQICVPTDLQPDEIPETLRERGVVALFWTEEDNVMSVSVTQSDDALYASYETLRDYLKADENVSSVELLLINGIRCCVYTDLQYDETSVVILDAGTVISIDFSPMSDERFAAIAAETIPSIMPLSE